MGGGGLFWGGVGELFPELGADREIEPLLPLFLQNLRMLLTLTIEVLRDRESLPGARLLGLWSSVVESKENLLDGALSSLMIAEEIEGFSALWVGWVGISGTAGTEGTSSSGKNDEGCLPKGSGDSGITGDSRPRGNWRGGYKFSPSLGAGSGFSEMSGGDPFLPCNDFCGWIVIPFDARCGGLRRSASRWEFRMSDVKVE